MMYVSIKDLAAALPFPRSAITHFVQVSGGIEGASKRIPGLAATTWELGYELEQTCRLFKRCPVFDAAAEAALRARARGPLR